MRIVIICIRSRNILFIGYSERVIHVAKATLLNTQSYWFPISCDYTRLDAV